jgi:hypothetical protein
MNESLLTYNNERATQLKSTLKIMLETFMMAAKKYNKSLSQI